MNLKGRLLKFAGKEGMVIDSHVSSSYIFRLCWKYGWMKVRGIWISLFAKGISSSIFVGKKVVLIEKKNMKIGRKTKLHDRIRIDALSTDGVIIGDDVVLGRETVIECTGSLTSVGKGVRIGDNTTFGNDCYFGAAGGIEIGNDVVAGQYIRFHSENHNYDDLGKLIKLQGVTHKGIKVGDNCWIGAGAVFLDGAELGDGCVVGANALVNKKFGPNLVIAGMPAKIIKKRGET